jgi:urea transport system substrate-binding protein
MMQKNDQVRPRREFLKRGALLASAGVPALWLPHTAAADAKKWPAIDPRRPIKVGILFSQTGAERIYSLECYKMALMAIDDINRSGGIHGAKLEPVIRDPASDWPSYTRYAKELLDQNVNLIWGCIVSASRKAALPAIQSGGGLLYYGMLYEGRECSHNIVTTGSCPNQQTEVGIPWIMKRKGKKTYIVGSNYIFPHTMSKQARVTLARHGGEVLGDKFVTFGVEDPAAFEDIIEDIRRTKPNWILSNLVAGNIGGFLKAYRKAGLNPEAVPIMHTAMFESSVSTLGPELCAGHYSLATYFESISSPENRDFVQRFKTFSRSQPEWRGDSATVTTLNEGVYTAAMACRAALLKANSAHPEALVQASRGLVFKAPAGYDVKIDADNLHLWLYPRIGQVNRRGEFEIVHQSSAWIRPEVFNQSMDSDKSCVDGGQFYIKGTRVPGPPVAREVIPQ